MAPAAKLPQDEETAAFVTAPSAAEGDQATAVPSRMGRLGVAALLTGLLMCAILSARAWHTQGAEAGLAGAMLKAEVKAPVPVAPPAPPAPPALPKAPKSPFVPDFEVCVAKCANSGYKCDAKCVKSASVDDCSTKCTATTTKCHLKCVRANGKKIAARDFNPDTSKADALNRKNCDAKYNPCMKACTTVECLQPCTEGQLSCFQLFEWLPTDVKLAFAKLYPRAIITDVEMDEEKGKETVEIDYELDGKTCEAEFYLDGTLAENECGEDEDDEEEDEDEEKDEEKDEKEAEEEEKKGDAKE